MAKESSTPCSGEVIPFSRSKRQQQYRSSTPERYIKKLLSYGDRRFGLPIEYVMSLYHKQEGRCAVSSIPLTYTLGEGFIATNISIDRINNEEGYIEGNVQLVCRRINSMKSDMSMDEFINMCKTITDYQRNQEDGHNQQQHSKAY